MRRLQGEWGLGPESGVGVWVRRLVPIYTSEMFWVSQVWYTAGCEVFDRERNVSSKLSLELAFLSRVRHSRTEEGRPCGVSCHPQPCSVLFCSVVESVDEQL